MSTFDGVIREYPLISIDCFLEEKNYASTAYFLSHCHKDHQRGLNDENFFNLLTARGFSKIYASAVSSHLLRNDSEYEHLSGYLVELPMEHPTLIILYDENGKIHSRVVVTLLTAGHCPGSVMFLIEGEKGRILYTGDFRLPIGSASRITYMHNKDGSVKPLESLYIDTTFCNERCLYIPSREDCLNEIVSLVEPWLCKGSNYIVCFFCPAQYAYEFVFVELFKRFGVKTHVTEEREKKYIGIKSIEDAVTSSAHEARIHACALEKSETFKANYYNYETPCGFFSLDNKPVHVMKIKPSAMFFEKQDFTFISQYDAKASMYRVCYSTHSSLSEIRDMINHLKPKQVFPNVIDKLTEKEILDLIFNPYIATISLDIPSGESSVSPLGQLKSHNVRDLSNATTDSFQFFDECYEIDTNKIKAGPSSNKNSLVTFNKDKFLETDVENTEKQDKLLKKEIFSQSIISSNSKSETKISDQSPLKWQNPVVSSEDEIFDHSSSFENSLRDKSDSEIIYGTSEENNAICLNKENDENAPVSAISTVIKSHNTECKNENNMDSACTVPKPRTQIEIKNKNNDSKILNHSFKENKALENLASCSNKKSSETELESNVIFNTVQSVEKGNLYTKGSQNISSPSASKINQNADKHKFVGKNAKDENECEFQALYKLSSQNNSSKVNYSNHNTDTQIKHRKQSFRYVKKINSSSDSEEDNISFKHVIKLPVTNKENTQLKKAANGFNSYFPLELKKPDISDASKINSNCSLVNVKKVNYSEVSRNDDDDNMPFKYVLNLSTNDKRNAHLKMGVNKHNSKFSSKFQKHVSDEHGSAYLPVSKFVNHNSMTSKMDSNVSTEFETVESSHKSERQCCKEEPDFKTDCNKYSNVNKCNFVSCNTKKNSNSCVSDSNLMPLSRSKRAFDTDNLSNLDSKKYRKENFNFQKSYSKSFQRAVNSILSSRNETSGIQNCETSFKAASDIKNSNVEVIDLSSDSSSEEIICTYSDVPVDEISTNMQMNLLASTSSKVDSKHCDEVNSDCAKIVSNTKFSSNINGYSRSKSNTESQDQRTSISFRLKEIHKNLPEQNVSKTMSHLKKEEALKYINETKNLSHQTQANFVEKNNSFAGNLPINSNLKPEIVEINYSSDLDDSPSLIAPIVSVRKMSSDSAQFNNSSLNPERCKQLCEERSNLDETKYCNKLVTQKHNFNDLSDSESTPEDLIVKSNLLPNNTLSDTRVIPGMILEDDSC